MPLRFGSNREEDDDFTTEQEWFSGGDRVNFDPNTKRIVSQVTPSTVAVFERARLPIHSSRLPNRDTRWLTLLPGFPDGSYGYAKIDRLIEQQNKIRTPRLYIEFVGQGDSDKPTINYDYGTMERADLVEAQWRAHGVRQTVVVTFDYSSLVLMELLRRQQESPSKFPTKIEHVLMINGGLFADGHTHPWRTTPLLKTRIIGRVGSAMAQRSNLVFDVMMKPLYSKSYRVGGNRKVMRRELRETEKAIRRHRGTSFLSNAAGFVNEHRNHADRWDLYNICADQSPTSDLTVHLVGSDEDPFEYRQIDLARNRLQVFYPAVNTQRIPGGHLSTTEKAQEITDMIEALTAKSTTSHHRVQPGWATLESNADQPYQAPAWSASRKQPTWTSLASN